MPQPHRPYSLPTPEEYFRGVSPLCRRILEDMARVQNEYGAKWEELSYEEQCKILDQTIVDEVSATSLCNNNVTNRIYSNFYCSIYLLIYIN